MEQLYEWWFDDNGNFQSKTNHGRFTKGEVLMAEFLIRELFSRFGIKAHLDTDKIIVKGKQEIF